MFTKEERSTFPYWFAHWCAVNMEGLNNHLWNPSFLLHDWYKPWLKLFWPYEKVQHFHRYHSKHHVEYFAKHPNGKKFNFKVHACDIGASRHTKENAPLTARETIPYEVRKMITLGIPIETINMYENIMYDLLDSVGGDI